VVSTRRSFAIVAVAVMKRCKPTVAIALGLHFEEESY
jgi:hypothetical protein